MRVLARPAPICQCSQQMRSARALPSPLLVAGDEWRRAMTATSRAGGVGADAGGRGIFVFLYGRPVRRAAASRMRRLWLMHNCQLTAGPSCAVGPMRMRALSTYVIIVL